MGSIRKRGAAYYAEVCVNGRRKGKTCRTKAAAAEWIKEAEKSLEAGPVHTVSDAFKRYRETYSSRKKTEKREGQRLDRLREVLGADTLLSDLTTDRLAKWRDDALQQVSAASVLRNWNLLNHVLAVAVREWGWLQANPLAALKRPAPPKPRSRVWTDREIETLLVATGWPGDTLQARVGDCLLFALETGMRAGEICGLRPEHVHEKHVHIPAGTSKNGSARDVPLSKRAREILEPLEDNQVFGITGTQLDALFRKARDRACLEDLRFHDARRTALTRLAKKVDALELAWISGHKDLRILLEVYYQPEIEDLADKLD